GIYYIYNKEINKQIGGSKMKKGWNEMTGLYTTRYYAKKQAYGDEVVVKVEHGYKIIKVTDYQFFKQKFWNRW
ncbi:MAG: hypothetical protein RR496_03910, partial [Lachnospiraceae bacterium]